MLPTPEMAVLRTSAEGGDPSFGDGPNSVRNPVPNPVQGNPRTPPNYGPVRRPRTTEFLPRTTARTMGGPLVVELWCRLPIRGHQFTVPHATSVLLMSCVRRE